VESWTYFFDPEDGGDMFLRNVGWNSTDYTASYPEDDKSHYCFYRLFAYYIPHWVLLQQCHCIVYCTVILNLGLSKVAVKMARGDRKNGGNGSLPHSVHPLLDSLSMARCIGSLWNSLQTKNMRVIHLHHSPPPFKWTWTSGDIFMTRT
jgi:hypothetical protein